MLVDLLTYQISIKICATEAKMKGLEIFFRELPNINVHEEAFSGSPAGICTCALSDVNKRRAIKGQYLWKTFRLTFIVVISDIFSAGAKSFILHLPK